MTLTNEQLLERLKWRYATKKFDATRKIPADVWATLEESLTLSPSSYGLQPWKFFVITDPATREKLLPHAWGQRQVVDASHLVVFTVKTSVGAPEATKLAEVTSQTRGTPLASLDGYKNMMIGSLTSKPPEQVREWMTRQVFIAHGVFLSACAMMG